ncbi:hypothetical protein [Chitinophaga sp.]|uniref:hypothetical protein n=1 Tax=Chitinophaga sp. TaxID=1869181 RepID=UPI002D80E141|nr:hypothetical protein [Chitinophaga sp.]
MFMLAAVIVINLSRLIISKVKKSKFTFYFFSISTVLVMVCFAFLGLSIGLLVGLSQSPVVHVTIPALLTFYGGFITFLFAKDSFKDEEGKLSVLLSAIMVSCFLIYGVELGSIEKNAAIKSAKAFELKYFELQEAIKHKYTTK